MMEKSKWAYFGTPDFSTLVLEALASAGLIPTLIVTTPDKPAGRGLTMTEPPVKKWAAAHGIRVIQPDALDEAVVEALTALNPDFLVVAAYGKILPASLLAIPRQDALNVHPSLLPRYRGTSPVESQILADEREVGVSIISMDEKMDHGLIIAQERVEITEWPIGRSALNKRLWSAGGALLARVLPAWTAGTLKAKPQDHERATFTKKISKEDGLIDLGAPARKNYLKYLAYEGWPGTYFLARGNRMKVTKAKFENERFVIERVVPEGKREMDYEDFARNPV